MYVANLNVGGNILKIPEIFSFLQADATNFSKITKSDEALNEDGFPVEPVYWPTQEGTAFREYYRGNGAVSIVRAHDDGLMIDLRAGVIYDSFFERKYVRGLVKVEKKTATVLADMKGRNLFSNVEDHVYAPIPDGRLSEADIGATLQLFVEEGRHVEGVAARLLALGLEHALVPFTQRTRVRNANASYWCTGRYRNDAITFSIQNTQQLLNWASPGVAGQEQDPVAVVWVGTADRVRGMSLLSRIMDEGGPMMMQESYLCRQFNPGRLLMVGSGALQRELRAVQPEHLMDAIDEALWILVTYNGLQISFIRNALRLLIRNLPIVDLAHYREQAAIFWQVQEGVIGDPVIDANEVAALRAAVDLHFSADAQACVGIDDDEMAQGMLSDLFRRVLYTPDPARQALAPPTVHQVDWRVCAILGALQSQATHTQDNVVYHNAVFDVTNPPNLAGFAAFERSAMNDVMLCFSGRAGYALYAYQAPAVAPAVANPPLGWVLEPNTPAAITDLTAAGNAAGHPDDGNWLRWSPNIGGAQLLPPQIEVGLLCYVVYQAIPVTEAPVFPIYDAPDTRLRRFDLPATFRMQTRATGALPDFAAEAPRMMNYARENARPGSKLEFLIEPEGRPVVPLNVMQKCIALIVGVAYCWDAAHGAQSKNDAYRRWMTRDHVDARTTTVPDELKLYLGGVRCRKYIEACGGLWTLCFTKVRSTIYAHAGHEGIFSLLRRPDGLASYIMKLRCAVEMSDQLGRVSNARLTGCQLPFLWPEVVDTRLDDAKIDQTTVMDTGVYAARQACFLAAVFDHPDSAVARSFGVEVVSTMRLREVSAIQGEFTESVVKHINWVTPQVLMVKTWMYYYGVASPSFVPDKIGRGWLTRASYSTRWQGVAPEYLPGAMMDREDEIWSAVLTGYVYTDWYPATYILAQFGTDLVVNVSDVRVGSWAGLTPIQMRLNLPYETRMGTVTVRGYDLNAMVSVRLPCNDQAQFPADAELVHSVVNYSPQGLVTGVTLPDVAAGAHNTIGGIRIENVDLKRTTFASRGLSFVPTRPNLILNGYPEVNRCAGQFWMRNIVVDKAISAGIGPGAQRLLQHLQPVTELKEEDDGQGAVVIARQNLRVDAPDVAATASVNSTIPIGSEVLHEVDPKLVGTGADSRIWEKLATHLSLQKLLEKAFTKLPDVTDPMGNKSDGTVATAALTSVSGTTNASSISGLTNISSVGQGGERDGATSFHSANSQNP